MSSKFARFADRRVIPLMRRGAQIGYDNTD